MQKWIHMVFLIGGQRYRQRQSYQAKKYQQKIPQWLQEKIREHRGVGFVCSNKLHEHVEKIIAHDSNNIVLQIKGKVDMIFHNTYQPHAGEKSDEKIKNIRLYKKSKSTRKDRTIAIY